MIDTSFLNEFYEYAKITPKTKFENGDINDILQNGLAFGKQFYGDDSDFIAEIKSMSQCGTLVLDNPYVHTTIKYLSHDIHDYKYIALITHVLNIILMLKKIHKNPLTIYVYLTNARRTVDEEIIYTSKEHIDRSDFIKTLRKKSRGFTVGGITYEAGSRDIPTEEDNKQMIILTKKEGLINLAIHEIHHYLANASTADYPDKINKIGDIQFPVLMKSTIDMMPWQVRNSEIYCESFGILYTSAYYAYLMSTNDMIEFVNKYTEIVNDELQYTYFLSSKIIVHFDIEQNDIYKFFHKGTEKPLYKNYQTIIPIQEYVFYRALFLKNLINNITFLDFASLSTDVLSNKVTEMYPHINRNDNNYAYMNHLLTTTDETQFWHIDKIYN